MILVRLMESLSVPELPPTERSNHQFILSRNDRGFKEVMVYYHIDRIQRYLQQIGFNNVLNHQITVNIDGRTDDNSHYSPAGKDLTFGTGEGR